MIKHDLKFRFKSIQIRRSIGQFNRDWNGFVLAISHSNGIKLYDCCCVFLKKLKRFKAVVVSCSGGILLKDDKEVVLNSKPFCKIFLNFIVLIGLM